MTELRYPNETPEYRQARDALLEEEQALVDRVKMVAEQRRKLPLGGRLREDYTFVWATDERLGQKVRFSELFGDKHTLLLYSFMFGSIWSQGSNLLTRPTIGARPNRTIGSSGRRSLRPLPPGRMLTA